MARGTEPSDFSSDAERAAWVRDNPDAPITCSCGGNGCQTCDGNGTVRAWFVDPQYTGYPHERNDGKAAVR